MAETTLAAWQEWAEVCEAGRCSEITREVLHAWGNGVVTAYSYKLAGAGCRLIDGMVFDKGYGWATVESYSIRKVYTERRQEKAGKSYKQFAIEAAFRSTNPRACMEKQFHRMVNAACREQWCIKKATDGRKKFEREQISIQAPIGGGRTVDDLLGDSHTFEPDDEKVLKALADETADELFEVIPFEQRLVLLCMALGLSYTTSPAMKAITGKPSSSIGDYFRYLAKEIRHIHVLESKFPNEDPIALKHLYLCALLACKDKLVIPWGRSEERCEPLFIEAEGKTSGGMEL